MTEATIQIDRITRLSRGPRYRGLWMLYGIFMATFVVRDDIDPEGAGEMWALLAFLYGNLMAVYIQSDKVIITLVDIATAKRIPVEE